MREKVTASILFKDRKQSYPRRSVTRTSSPSTAIASTSPTHLSIGRSVAHPFVGDYVRLRASAAWRRRETGGGGGGGGGSGGGGGGEDRYVVFADVVGKVSRASGRSVPTLLVVSTAALLLLEPRSLRLKRRVPAQRVRRLSLSPAADDLLAVHVAQPAALPTDSADSCTLDPPGCVFAVSLFPRKRVHCTLVSHRMISPLE